MVWTLGRAGCTICAPSSTEGPRVLSPVFTARQEDLSASPLGRGRRPGLTLAWGQLWVSLLPGV